MPYLRRGRRGNVMRKRYKTLRYRKRRGGLTSYEMRRSRVSASSISRPVHYFRRSSEYVAIALTSNVAGSNGVGFVGAGFLYRLNNVVNVSDFTNLYDQYKIISVKHHFKWSNISQTDDILSNPPVLQYFTDHDDATNPTHLELLERSATRSFAMRPNKVYSIGIRPAVLSEVYRSSVTTGYVPKWGQYLDMGNNDIPHYGLKVGWSYPATTAIGQVVHWVTITFACKGVR